MTAGLAIETDRLTKSYNGRRALDGVDLEVQPATVLGLLGPNGAGKTTLIRLVTTVIEPDSGTFSVAGASHSQPVEIRRRVGVLPESGGFPAGQTGEDVLVFHARLHGRTRSDAQAEARHRLDEVGLGDRSGSLVSSYSRGMRQRLGIARALVNRPQVVFLDEPTLGLDPAGRRQVLEIIAGVARDHGSTVVLSTHLLAEVEEVCDRVVILNGGRIVADGTVTEIASRAAAPRRGRLRTVAEQAAAVQDVLVAVDGVASVTVGEQPGEVAIDLAPGVTAEIGSSRVLAALLAADVPVLSFGMEAGRLSDAYLEITGEA